MSKNESPTDQSKFPSKDLFDEGKVGDKVGEDDKFTKSNQNNKMLAYFNALSEEQRAEILENLRDNKEKEEFTGNKNKPLGFETAKVEVKPEEIKKAELYDNIMKEQPKKQLLLKYGLSAIPYHSLASGLQITLSSRNERDLCKTRIIIGKEERGSDAITRKKTQDKVVKRSSQRSQLGI
jgi:hypothetical protein